MKSSKRIWLILSAVVAFGLAAGVFYYAYTTYDQLVATTSIVVTTQHIKPYTVVTASHLDVKDMPRAIVEENIYVSADEIIGRIAMSHIPAGSVIYRPLVVVPSRFRYVDDPHLEIVSIPVDPTRAVGGQIKAGHVVNIYRAAQSTRAADATDPLVVLSQRGAAVELLATAPVVDVRSGQGDDVVAPAAPSGVEQGAQTSRGATLAIVTLAVPSEITPELIRLAVEQRGSYELWLSLAPTSPAAAGVPFDVPSGQGSSR